MPGFKSAAALTALIGAAAAAPLHERSTATSSAGVFKVTNTPSGRTLSRSGPAAYAKAMNKYNMSMPANWVPPVQNNAATSTSSSSAPVGSVAANSINNDVEYVAMISIGGQMVPMDFDTGSSDLWTFNTLMQSQYLTGRSNVYDPNNSTTFKQTTGDFSVSYGDGSYAEGSIVGTDTVNIGGASVNNQIVELPDVVGDEFIQDTSSNGLVGLAYSTLNTVQPNQANTFWANLSPQLSDKVFTANLQHDATGAYEFGGIDNSSFTGTMQWADVNTTSGFWQFTSSNFQVGSNGQVLTNTNASPAIADTGTSLALVDPPVAQTYYSAVSGAANVQGNYIYPNDAQLPDFSFSLGDGNTLVTIPSSKLTYTSYNSTHSFGGLQSNNGEGTQIFGDIMFKAQFVAFDFGNNRVGFAPHASNSTN